MKVIYAKGYTDKQAGVIVSHAIEETKKRGWLKKLSDCPNHRNNLNDLKEPFDIYHCHSDYSLESIPIAQKLGAKVILQRDSAHTEIMIRQLEWAKELWHFGQYKDMCNINPRQKTNVQRQIEEYEKADYILLASKWEKLSFELMDFPQNKLKIVPFTADTEKFKPKTDISKRNFSVCLGGNACLRKGFPWAKESCKLINEPLNVISGVDFNDMPRELDNYSVCLAPTVEDGYPHQVLASMSMQQIPIVSQFTGTKDIIKQGNNGFIVDITNPHTSVKEIADILKWLKDDKSTRTEMGIKARETIQKRHWNKYSEGICKMYEEVMKSG